MTTRPEKWSAISSRGRSKGKSLRLTPNVVTSLSLPLAVCAAFFLSQGVPYFSFLLILLCGCCDILDGYLAKKKGLATPFGAFLDSTIDRIVDLLLFSGILFFYLREGDLLMAGVTYWVMGGSLVVSYARARAENFIPDCRVGFWERPERIILILMGLLTNRLKTVLWILAFGIPVTVLHRIIHTRSILQKKEPSPFQRLLLHHYPRKSWSYRILVLLVILLTLSVKLP